jgi:hypothetical protein
MKLFSSMAMYWSLSDKVFITCRLRRQQGIKGKVGDTPNPGKGLRPLHSCCLDLTLGASFGYYGIKR